MQLTLQKQYVELSKLTPISESHGANELAAAYKIKIAGIFDSDFFNQLEDGDALDLVDALYHPNGKKKRAVAGIHLKGKFEQHVIALSQMRGGSEVSHEFDAKIINNFMVRAAEEKKLNGSFWFEVEPCGSHADKQILFINNLLSQREFMLEILPPRPGANSTQTDLEDPE